MAWERGFHRWPSVAVQARGCLCGMVRGSACRPGVGRVCGGGIHSECVPKVKPCGAEAAGCTTQNGMRMLLYQALASLTLWTGVDVREEIFNLEELQKMCSG